MAYFGSYLRKDKLWICMEYCGGGSLQVTDILTKSPLKKWGIGNFLLILLNACKPNKIWNNCQWFDRISTTLRVRWVRSRLLSCVAKPSRALPTSIPCILQGLKICISSLSLQKVFHIFEMAPLICLCSECIGTSRARIFSWQKMLTWNWQILVSQPR